MEEDADNPVRANCSADEVDRLSNLPKPLLCHILLNLPTKDVVKSCVLSSQWRNLWRSVPGLDLGYCDFPEYNAFVSFVDGFLGLDSESCLEKFKLKSQSLKLKYEWQWDEPDVAHVTRWINTVLKRKVEHLHVLEQEWHLYKQVEVPLSVYTCKSLRSLKLRDANLATPKSVSLPSLKVIKLDAVNFPDDLAFGLLVSGCPVLESLTVKRSVGDNLKVLCVSSQSLLSFTLVGLHDQKIEENLVVEMDAPRLEYLNLVNDQTDRFSINNLGSLVKVDMDTAFNLDSSHVFDQDDILKRIMIRSFLLGISSVKQMAITSDTLEVIYVYSLPLFGNLSMLHVDFYNNKWEMLPVVLESCPNLKNLTLGFRESLGKGGVSILPRPHCFLPTLETVEIVKPMIDDDAGEMKLLTYILENSTVLKQLTFCLGDIRKKEGPAILRKLLALPKRSSSCQFYVR